VAVRRRHGARRASRPHGRPLDLEDTTPQRADRRRIAIGEIAEVRLAGIGERVGNLKTLVLRLSDGTGVRLAVWAQGPPPSCTPCSWSACG
jgi:hypothetical protein